MIRTLREACIRSYKVNKNIGFKADYKLFALVGYYLVEHPGSEREHLRKDINRHSVREQVGYAALNLL